MQAEVFADLRAGIVNILPEASISNLKSEGGKTYGRDREEWLKCLLSSFKFINSPFISYLFISS